MFVALLRRLGVRFSVHLPWEAPESGLLLTTREEAASLGLEDGRRSVLLYEDLTGDDVVDGAVIASRLTGGREELVVGLDPGSRIGVVVHYGGAVVHSGAYQSPRDVASLLARLLRLRARSRVVKLGFGNPEMAYRILREAGEVLLANYVIELVDERGTSKGGARSRRDVEAAIRISRRRGRAVAPGSATAY